MGDEYKLIDFLWGNPLNLQEYKVSKGLAEEIHSLIVIVSDAHKLAKTCDCDVCKKIEEITRLPIFG